MASRSVMSPEWGDLQQQTDWRALSGNIPFNKRFDPNGPYEKAFEAGGWDVMKSQMLEEKKKREQQRAAMPSFLPDLFRNLPRYLDYANKTENPFSITATPWE